MQLAGEVVYKLQDDNPESVRIQGTTGIAECRLWTFEVTLC
jgi:hypothetical protein